MSGRLDDVDTSKYKSAVLFDLTGSKPFVQYFLRKHNIAQVHHPQLSVDPNAQATCDFSFLKLIIRLRRNI